MSASNDRFTPLEPRQELHSSDAVAIHLPLAGPSSRILAYLIDWIGALLLLLLLFTLLVVMIPQMADLLSWVTDWLPDPEADGPPDEEAAMRIAATLYGALLIATTFAEVLWFVFWEQVSGGRSPGKRIVGLRVMRDGGLPLTLGASLVRNLLRIADVLPSSYVTGLISIVATDEAKRLGDLAAGTVVVRVARLEAAPPLEIEDDADEAARFSFRRDQIARVGDAEAALLRQTLRRLETLTPEQAEQAVARATEVLTERLEWAEEIAPPERLPFLRALWRATRNR